MTIGSAASLSGTVPQPPLSHFRTPDLAVVPYRSDDNPPPRPVLLRKAVGDPPQAHVLVVAEDAVAALELQRLLRDCGYRLVGPATSPEEARRLLARGHRPILCALLDACMPGGSAVAEELAAQGVPVLWIATGVSDAFSWDRREEPVLRRPFGRREIVDAIERSIRQAASRRTYATPPPQPVWPRVFPQL
jgi:CheY-like chemotaxis protein